MDAVNRAPGGGVYMCLESATTAASLWFGGRDVQAMGALGFERYDTNQPRRYVYRSIK